MDFERLIAAWNDYAIVASVIVIAIRNMINFAALDMILYCNFCVIVLLVSSISFSKQLDVYVEHWSNVARQTRLSWEDGESKLPQSPIKRETRFARVHLPERLIHF